MRERESDKGRTLRKLSNLEANRYRRFTTPEETHKEWEKERKRQR